MDNKSQITELTERDLLRIYQEAEMIMSVIKDEERPLMSKLNQVQSSLNNLHSLNLAISEWKGKITLLGK
ncbi:hypothetical protein [Parabacteroides distasonis]|mgnify:CR=1 FL=1|uniref:hypothetical protein n=1 Tax=Parabacteroides distasonis TaxID=823 RepID=UPI003F234FE0